MIRVVKDKNNPYVMVNKTPIHDPNLSWKSKGILVYLLSLPDDWQIYETELEKHASDGLSSLKSGIKELIEKGYVERNRIRNSKGHFVGYEYCVYEVPTEMRKSNDGKSNNGESPTTNNDLSNKDYKDISHFLETTENGYISEYLKILKRYRPKHKRVSEDNLELILDTIEKLESEDISLNEWISVVEDYFDNLPDNNDGDILAFLKGTKRHFDIDI